MSEKMGSDRFNIPLNGCTQRSQYFGILISRPTGGERWKRGIDDLSCSHCVLASCSGEQLTMTIQDRFWMKPLRFRKKKKKKKEKKERGPNSEEKCRGEIYFLPRESALEYPMRVRMWLTS